MAMDLDPDFLRKNAPEFLRAAQVELAKRSLKEFTRQSWHILEPGTQFKDGWVIDAICEHLEAVLDGHIKRLVITVPPGSMKSRLARVNLPLYAWARKPWMRFIGASYALSLSERDNYYARTVLMSDWYQKSFGVSISAEQGAKVNFDNSSMGGIRAISVGGATTGFRGDLNILDDGHNASEGESDAKRSEAVQWFLETFQTRVNDLENSPIIVIGQRIHEEDIPGAALELGYEHLNVPMHYDPARARTTSIGWRDPRTTPDELMWAERFPETAVKRLEQALGPYAAAAQLEQHPVPRKGGLINADALRIADELPDEPFIWVRAWDMAASEGAGAFTVGVLMGYAQNSQSFWVADVKRKQLGPGGVRTLIETTAQEDGIATKIILPKDPGQAGKAQVGDLIAMLAGYNVVAEAQSGAKETRAAPMSAQIEIGAVHVLQRTWTRDFVAELRFFPKGKFKDQVDASASAFNALAPLTRLKKRTLRLAVAGEGQSNWAKVG